MQLGWSGKGGTRGRQASSPSTGPYQATCPHQRVYPRWWGQGQRRRVREKRPAAQAFLLHTLFRCRQALGESLCEPMNSPEQTGAKVAIKEVANDAFQWTVRRAVMDAGASERFVLKAKSHLLPQSWVWLRKKLGLCLRNASLRGPSVSDSSPYSSLKVTSSGFHDHYSGSSVLRWFQWFTERFPHCLHTPGQCILEKSLVLGMLLSAT